MYVKWDIIGRVSLSDALLQHVAEQYGTPTYIYDLEAISRALSRLRQALPEAGIHYAVKANPNGAVLRHLATEGVGAEVITLGELTRALAAGIPAAQILLGGPGQDTELIKTALRYGVRQVSLDSYSQWRLWQAEESRGVGFLVRLNPALDPHTHEHLATGAASSKFGLLRDEAERLAEELAGRGQLLGFHVHAGSQIGELSVYDEILAQLAGLCQQFPASLLDIGGGFAVPGFPLEPFARRWQGFVRQHSLQLALEPGRYLVAEAGYLLTRVVQVKTGPINHVIADAGMADLLRPALYGALHPIRLVGDETDRSLVTVDIDGPLCENADRLGRARTLPSPQRGDLLLVEQAGAYGFTMASNYASSLRPAEVAVLGGELILARRRETVADLLRLEDA